MDHVWPVDGACLHTHYALGDTYTYLDPSTILGA